MRYLLDTHVIIWAMIDSDKLSRHARTVLSDANNDFYVSTASLWEIALKHDRRPEDIPVTAEQVCRYCDECGVRYMPIMPEHAAGVNSIENIHADPFDRMLISQAVCERMKLMSHDSKIQSYGDMVLSV